MHILMIYTLLFIQERDLSKSIYFSQDSNMHIVFNDEDLYFLYNPFESSPPIPHWVRNDTTFFGARHEKDYVLLKSEHLMLGKERFELLSLSESDRIFHYIEISDSIRAEVTDILKEAHSKYSDFRVGNITINLKKVNSYNDLLIDVVCRFRDSDGIDRGFDAKLTCQLEGDMLMIQLMD